MALVMHLVYSTKSLKICGCKRWCPKDLRVCAPTAPMLTYSLLFDFTRSLKLKKHECRCIAIGTFVSEIISTQCDLPLVNLALNLNTLGSTKLLLGLMIGPHPLHVFRRRFLGPFESGAQWNKFFKICSKMIWQFSKGSILIFRFFPVYHSNQCFAAYLCINNNKSNDMTLNKEKVLNHSASTRSF